MGLFRRDRKDKISSLFQPKARKKNKLRKKARRLATLEKKLTAKGFDLNWHVSATLLLAGIGSLVFLSVYVGMFLEPIFLLVIWSWIFCAIVIFIYWDKKLYPYNHSTKKLVKVISFYIAVTMITQLVFCPLSLKVVSGFHSGEMNLLRTVAAGLFFIVNWLVNLFIFHSFVSAYYVKVRFKEIFVLHAMMILVSVIIFGILY